MDGTEDYLAGEWIPCFELKGKRKIIIIGFPSILRELNILGPSFGKTFREYVDFENLQIAGKGVSLIRIPFVGVVIVSGRLASTP